MKGKIGLLISHSDNYFGVEYGLHQLAQAELKALAEELGCEVVPVGPIRTGAEAKQAREQFDACGIDYLLMFIADFTTGDVMIAFDGAAYPIGLWFPKEPRRTGDIQLNAAVTANLFASIAQRTFRKPVRCDWYYGSPDDPQTRNRMALNLSVACAKSRIEHATVGILGEVAPTFYNLENSRLSERFPHMKFVRFDMARVRQAVAQVTPAEAEAARQLIASSCNQLECAEKSVENSAKVYVALKKIAMEHQIDCLAAACWPDFQDEFQIVPCVIYTLLGSELNVPVACEGDVGGAISLLIAKELSGSVPTLMDLTAMDAEDNSLLLWHCGIGSRALEPAEGVRIIHHPMLDRKNPHRELMGLSYDYHFKPCALTVLRYSNNDRLVCFECSVKRSSEGYSGTRGYLSDFTHQGQRFAVEDVVDTLFKNGIEHHLIVCPGKIESALAKLGQWMGIPTIRIERNPM